MAKAMICMLFFALTLPLLGQDPNKQELQSAPQADFINFSGIHRQQDSRSDIYNIGVYLAEKIEAQRSDYYGKYTLLRSLTPGNETQFDADILVINERAGVDHVRNLRLIISGYLVTIYRISPDQALTLATFITYYNVYYRKQIEYVKTKYKPEVLALLDPNKIGLEKDYHEWAGKTQLLIPLSSDTLLNQAPKPDLAETGQPAITNELMQNEGEEHALELRTDMVKQRKGELKGKQEQLDKLSETQQQQQQQLGVDRKRLNGIIQQSDNSAQRKKAEEQLEQNQQKDAINQGEQNLLNRKQQQLAQQKEAVNKEENQLKLDSQASSRDNPPLYFPLLAPSPEGGNRLVQVSLASNRLVGQSKLQDLRSASLLITDEALYVVSGKPDARLTRVLPGNLEVAGQSKEKVFPSTAIWRFDGLEGLYAVVAGKTEGEWTLGHYDSMLSLLQQSPETILPYTSLQYYKGKFLLQASSGQLIVLDPNSLAKEADIK